MKYSQYIGIATAIILIVVCTLPWVYIPSLQIYLTGINGKASAELNFGSQIQSHGFFATIMIICFFVSKVWAKRTNVFLGAMNMAWAAKNFLIFSMCRGGECPEKQPALYVLVICAAIMLLMSLFPKMAVSQEQ
ncbi:MAG: hypothetical protein K2Q21_00110 [Chitinophagaceae bacterium]|nr:hypothetical protein [Chitinophagaceae bacterium]